jgi:hypothetical protein
MRVDDEIARFDWSRIPTYMGYAEMVPDAVRALIVAPDRTEADRLGAWMEDELLSVAGPCEACLPVAAVLIAALAEMTPAGRSVALSLLLSIAACEITGPAHEQIGAVDVDEIRQVVAAGFHQYVTVLQAESSSRNDLHHCIGLVRIVASDDPSLAAAAINALEAIRTTSRARGQAFLIDDTLARLTELSSKSS